MVYLVPDTSNLANTTPILVVNDTVNLSVNPNLNYNVYVNGICSAGDTSILTGPVSFSTPCVSFVSFPYIEEFNSWPPIVGIYLVALKPVYIIMGHQRKLVFGVGLPESLLI